MQSVETRYTSTAEEDDAAVAGSAENARKGVAARLIRIEKSILQGAPWHAAVLWHHCSGRRLWPPLAGQLSLPQVLSAAADVGIQPDSLLLRSLTFQRALRIGLGF